MKSSGSSKALDSRKLSITLPRDLDRELKKVAKREHRSVSGIIQEASRYYLNIRKFEELQSELASKARNLGITSELQIEEIISESRFPKK